jgi:hypothetical protein
LVALAGLVAWVTRHHAPLVSLQPCVTPDRRLSWLGLHLALLHEHPDCAVDQLAIGPADGGVTGLVVMIAAPTLALNLVTLVGLLGFWAALRAIPARVAMALRRLRPRRPELPRIVCGRTCPPPTPTRPLRPSWLDRSPILLRGPPLPFEA